MAARTSSARTTKAKRGRPVRVTKGVLEKSKRRIPGRLSQIRGSRSQRSFARELGVNVSLDWLLLGRGKPYRRA